MKNKKYVPLLILPLIYMCACTGQGGLPPLPKDVLDFDASMEVLGVDQSNGDVTVEYTLVIKNIGEDNLEKVILKDFNTPSDVIMREDYFVITDLDSGEEYAVIFNIIVLGWAAGDEIEQEWEVDYTLRIEEGSAYTEQEGYYIISLSR
jgi:hypothetical protein